MIGKHWSGHDWSKLIKLGQNLSRLVKTGQYL